jgi:hypothetical protein
MKSNNSLYDIVQIILFSTAMACIVIAGATFIFGDDNIFQQSVYPSLAIIAALSIWLLRLPKTQNPENQ